MTDYETLGNLMGWIRTGGLGIFISILLKQVGFSESKLSDSLKRIVVLALCFGIPALVIAIQSLPADQYKIIEQIYSEIVFPGVVAYTGSQMAYLCMKGDTTEIIIEDEIIEDKQ